MIPHETRRRCVELANSGVRYSELYREYIKPISDMSFRSFSRRMLEWKAKLAADEQTLECANLAYKFAPYASTVQVNGKGEMVQAWIKQNTEDAIEELLNAIRDNTPPAQVHPTVNKEAEGMLEIPLFDMHFGIADFEHYRNTLGDILQIVCRKHWDKIIIPVGQDLFHNDSIAKGITTKGTLIEKVDLTKAVNDAKTFYYNLIDTAIQHANSVDVIYSPGNHDKTIGWLFLQILKERYGDIVDDSTRTRKVVWWKGCFIGLTHGEKSNDNAAGLRGKFTKEFPALYATATVREIHTGHLHRESDSRDEYGVQIRRLCTKNKDDEWTDEEGYMSQKRFMLFEWLPNKLKSIHYV
jgi:UDP-2,3-diacylglucosamine pyrophosphatase LpxH